MKKVSMLICLSFILLLFGCSKDKQSPTDQLNVYIDYWKSNEFGKMYEMLSKKTKNEYSSEQFIDRYEKVYRDLEVEDLQITYPEWTKEDESKLDEKGTVTIPLHVKMVSLAGPIEFSYDIELSLDKEDEEPVWYVEWNPGLIFPDLADGGKIKIETESPKRGEIIDRNQMPLAINDIAYEIGVVPNLFQNEEIEKEQIASLLQLPVNTINDKLRATWVQPDHFVPLKTLPKSAEEKRSQLLNIPAVKVVEKTGRVYPSSYAAAHLTGYIGQITVEEMKEYPEGTYKDSDFIGKRGLEKLYEEKLKGEEGKKILIVKKDENEEEKTIVLAEKPVKNGEHVQVTIDVNLQEKIFQAYNHLSGTAAAINPKTGEILALVSSPAFDPNELTYGISQNRWDELMEAKDQPFVNRFTSTYAPGSVIKPVVAAVGLSNGAITHDEGIQINGLTWKNKGWGDYKITRVSSSEKPVNLKDAIVRSDNIYFAMKAIDMGKESFIKGFSQLGFGEKLPLSYPFPISQISNDGNLNDEILLANTSYGQGEIEVSSLHMALLYTPFINEGNVIKPNLLMEEKKGEIWSKNIMSKEDADLMQQYLRAVVTDGTAKVANDKDFPISGKTGTAELKLTLDSKGHENGWFVGYPTDDQDLLIAMMMEKVEDMGTSSLVAKKTLQIMKEYKNEK